MNEDPAVITLRLGAIILHFDQREGVGVISPRRHDPTRTCRQITAAQLEAVLAPFVEPEPGKETEAAQLPPPF